MTTVHGDNLVVRVRRAPQGVPAPDDFVVDTAPIVPPADGEVLFRASYLSMDPSARRRLPTPGVGPGPLGRVAGVGDIVLAGVVPPTSGLDGALVGEVVESRHPRFRPGDLVRGGNSWQTFHTVPGELLDLLTPVLGFRLPDALGILGRPGFVAHCGLRHAATVRPGSTVLVSAAGGAVGMAAGQIARLAGARVVGIASGDKPSYVIEELGFADCIDRSREDIEIGLDRTCPDGVDLFFDNVGGLLTNQVFDRLNDFGQLVVCGMAGEYNATEPEHGPPLRPVLRKRLRIQGFIVYDHYAEFPGYHDWALQRINRGELSYREDVSIGLASAPAALADVLTGKNNGKKLVRIGPEPEVLKT